MAPPGATDAELAAYAPKASPTFSGGFSSTSGATTLTLEPGQCQHFGLLPGVGWLPLTPGTFA